MSEQTEHTAHDPLHGQHEEHHIISYSLNTKILIALLFLTGVTVGAAQIDFGYLNVVVAMSIATTKALLVVLYFMHLRYEKAYLGFMVFIAFFMLAIAIGFTFFDLAYRT